MRDLINFLLMVTAIGFTAFMWFWAFTSMLSGDYLATIGCALVGAGTTTLVVAAVEQY